MVRTCLDEAKKQRATKNISFAYHHLMKLTQANATGTKKMRQINKKPEAVRLHPDFIQINGLMADEVVQAHHIYDQKMKYACNNGKNQRFLATLRFSKRHMDGKAPLRHIKFADAFSFCKKHMDGVLSENLPDMFCNLFTF